MFVFTPLMWNSLQRSLHLLDCVQVCVASADDLYDREKRVSSISHESFTVYICP